MNRVVFLGAIISGSLLCGCVNSGDAPSGSVRAQELTPSRIVIEKEGGLIETDGDIFIPADEEWVFSEDVEVRAFGAIVIDGVMRGLPPSNNRITAPSMTLSSVTGIVIKGELHAFPGADGNYPGANGGDAGALFIHAPVLVLNDLLIGAPGGAGYPDDGRGENRKRPIDDGRGGTGGLLEVYARVIGPRSQTDPGVTYGFPDIQGGTGGYGGGGGGGVAHGAFRELPWMVKYRQIFLLADSEIDAARARGEIR